MKFKKNKLLALNKKLQDCIDEETDLELLLNPLIHWTEKDKLYKNKLDLKYAGREFDISRDWKDKVIENRNRLDNDPNKDPQIEIDNEEKRKIFIKLSQRKDELNILIQKIIKEILPDEFTLTDEQVENIFK